jgi:hypothetical protein
MHSRDRVVMLGAVLLAGVGILGSCGDPTGPVATHPDGVIERSDALTARPYGAAISSRDIVYVTQLDNERVARIDLPARCTSGSCSKARSSSWIAPLEPCCAE